MEDEGPIDYDLDAINLDIKIFGVTFMNFSFQFIPLTSSPKEPSTQRLLPKSFQIITWNLLAPCWKRTSYGRESDNQNEWEERLMRSIKVILEKDVDIICLQELWFDDLYLKIFTEAISDSFVMYSLKRVHNKPDGLAILLRKGLFPSPKSFGIDFQDFGSRVGLMLVWDSFSLLNTHLTFPHNNAYDSKLRMSQVRNIQSVLEEHSVEHHVVIGDFNGSIYDEAVSTLMESAKLYPMIEHSNFMTHISHRGDEMACDLILSNRNIFSDVCVSPIELSLSDHCIVQAKLHVSKEKG